MKLFPHYHLKYYSALEISQVTNLLKDYIEQEKIFYFQSHKPYQGYVGKTSFSARRITLLKVFPPEISGQIKKIPEGIEIFITIKPWKPILAFTLIAVGSINFLLFILLAIEIINYIFGNIPNYTNEAIQIITTILITMSLNSFIYLYLLIPYLIFAELIKRDFTEIFSNNQARLFS